MGLDVTLVYGLRAELPLDDEVCLFEAIVNAADFQPRMTGDVIGELGVKEWRAVCHRVFHGGNHRKRLVLDVDQVKCLFGFVGAVRGDGGDWMTLEEHLAARENLAADVEQVLRWPARRSDNRLVLVFRKIGRRQDGAHSGSGFCPRSIDRLYVCVGVRTSEELGVQHPRK